MSGCNKDPRLSRGKKPLTHGWIVVPSKTYPDRVYFYNTVTKCATWNNPCEDTNNKEPNKSLSDSSSSERNHTTRTKYRSPLPSRPKKQKSRVKLHHLERDINTNINTEIEDYDEHDQYFASSAFNLSHSQISPPNSPNSSSSFSSSRTNISDSDRHTDSNLFLDNNKKELWVHFVSSPEKSSGKKSVALSDFQEPSTSRNSRREKAKNSDRRKSVSMADSFCKTKNSSSRKKKKKQSQKNNTIGKTTKNVGFKKRDKTPAQTRLLNLRKENAEKLKKLAAKYPEFAISTNGNVEKSFEIGRTSRSSFSDESHPVAVPETNDANFMEEMDWEPSSEESDVRNINVFRQQFDKPKEISNNIFFTSNPLSTLPYKTHSWFLVLDTNIFVSCLDFIKELRDTQVPDLGYPVIYVPWRVLQELDHLKDTKINAVEKNISRNVRRAIAYLNENFKERHPRIFGQSFEDFVKMVDFETSAPDDEILQTCIKFQKEHIDKKLMLLTNDKNLESKAIVSNVEVYSKDSFQKKFLNFMSDFTNSSALNKPSNTGAKADNYLCEVKTILKDFLTSVVETEMKIAFESDWIRLVVKKPPWSVKDVMECLLKHWRSVFFINFSKETHTEIEELYETLFKRGAVSSGEVINIITKVQRLIVSIEKSQKEKRPYLDLIPTALSKLSDMLRVLSPNNFPQTDNNPSSSFEPANRPTNDFYFTSQQIQQNEETRDAVAKVKTLFKDIWDSLRGFCCSISDIIHSSGGNSEAVIQEMRLKLSQMLNEVEELVTITEKILELHPQEINERHPLINYFNCYLLHIYPNMLVNFKNELPRYLATFFTDFEGRSLLACSLKDFKEFIQDLSKASEYFNAQNTC